MKSKIALSLEGHSLERAARFITLLGKWLRAVKIHDLLDTYGPPAITVIEALGGTPWVDYKLHDTKDTVALRVRALVRNGAKIITVHASGGVPMMKAAVEATLSGCDEPVAEIWAITVLTSLSDDPNDVDGDEIGRIYGKDRTREQIVREFTLMAKEAGVRTVVCSALEVKMLSSDPEFALMEFTTPGTRREGAKAGQQKRFLTHAEAITNGSTCLVGASQVTGAEDPAQAFQDMAKDAKMEL
jgi:orotidine-5'-phosphate decarboxylase